MEILDKYLDRHGLEKRASDVIGRFGHGNLRRAESEYVRENSWALQLSRQGTESVASFTDDTAKVGQSSKLNEVDRYLALPPTALGKAKSQTLHEDDSAKVLPMATKNRGFMVASFLV